MSDIQDFTIRVERLCDFLINEIKEGNIGVEDRTNLKVLEDLKEDAANFQFDLPSVTNTVEGLADYMKGVDIAPADETKPSP